MNRYANKRDTVESSIVTTLRSCGVFVYLTDKPFDAVLGYRGKTYLGEFKDPAKKGWKNEFTKAQEKFMDAWKGGEVVVFRSDDDAINWVNTRD